MGYMRYLFGDLTEFPFQENTLDLLSRFVDTAVAVLKLHHRIGELLDSIEEDRRFLEQALADVSELHETLIGNFHDVASSRPDEDVVTILVQGASDQVSRYLEDGKDRLETKVEERIARTKAEVLGLHSETLEHLSRFFIRSGVPVNSQALRCELQEGQYLAEADVLDMNGVRCGYKLDASSIDFFSTSRRFGDLMPGRHELPVDTKRAWLKKEPVVQTMRLDDAVLVELLDDDENGEFRLSRRVGNGGEGLRVRIAKGMGKKIETFRIDSKGVMISIPAELLQSDNLELLTQFWKAVTAHVPDLYTARVKLTSITVGGEEVIEARRVPELVRRMIDFLAPTVREIDVRSPAVEELCLKMEREGGRREEIYVPKLRLAERIMELPEELRELFEPLGIPLDEALAVGLVEQDDQSEEEGEDLQVVSAPPNLAETVNSDVEPVFAKEDEIEVEDRPSESFDASDPEGGEDVEDVEALDDDDIEIDVDEAALYEMSDEGSSDDPKGGSED